MNARAERAGLTRTLGWALFLACSWTWVIGMWLPIYLLRDFGWAGYAAFFVPNVLGAAAMGLVLRSPGASERLVQRHPRAPRYFSLWTILFHLAFFSIITPEWFRELPPPASFALILLPFVIALWFSAMGSRGWRIAAWITFTISLICAAGLRLATPDHVGLSLPPIDGLFPRTAALLAAPAMLFGFALCPYLDLTFHRARREAPGSGGTAAFLLGFGLFFPAMILLTALYKQGLDHGVISLYLLLHLTLQSAFTIGAHLRELRGPSNTFRLSPVRLGSSLVGLVLLSAAGYAATRAGELRPGYAWSRLFYEFFLAPYALVFPAIVWVGLILATAKNDRNRLIASVVGSALAAPMFAAGFVFQRHLWMALGAGVLIVTPLLAAWFVRERGGTGRAAHEEPPSA